MPEAKLRAPAGVEILGSTEGFAEILTLEALDLVADLTRSFGDRVGELLDRRRAVQARIDAGERPAFLEETTEVRGGDLVVGSQRARR
jgi:malate synthase